MATANELFAANGEDYIVIDSDLRTMTFPASVNNIGVENDKDVHKLNFKMPRYFSGYDLSEFIIHINYVNANGDADMYYVLDPTIEENEIKFSWLVGRHACLYRGSVTFIVCLKLADGEGDVAQEYNTTLASLQVLPGLETEPTILETEHDIIEQLLLSINDTNAKIKAVLDTGLTPEQIAEFYNKSKTYDTQIATLNSRTNVNVVYSDSEVSALGGVNAAIADAVAQKRFSENVPFSGMLQANSRYHIDGYIYPGYQYGSIWMHRFDNDGLFVSIKAGAVSISKLPTRSEVDTNKSDITTLKGLTAGRAYSDIGTMYTEILALLEGNQKVYFSASGSLVTALTNNGTSSVCRVIATKADNTTLDYMLWSSGSGVFYTGRIGANATVSQVTKYARQDDVDALTSRTIPWTSYDGRIEVTLDDVSFSGISDFAKSMITSNGKKWVTVRVEPSTSAPKVEPFYGASFVITINCSSVNYGWGWLQSDNAINQLYYGRLGGGIWTWYKVGKQDDIDALNSRTTVTNGVNYANLNDLKSTAIYSYDTTSANVQNAPDTGTYFSGTLYVTYYNESKSTQVFIRSSGDVWTRFWWNDTWRSWTKLANQSEVDALEARVTALESK